VGKDWGNAK